jgi:hypothetical protein
MKQFSFLVIITLSLSFFSCDRSSNEKIVKTGWIRKNLCDRWIIQLPPGTSLKGIGCTNDLKSPSIIDFPNDSIQIKFYAFGPTPDEQSNCNFDSDVKWAKENCSGNICQGDGSIIYEVFPYIDYQAKIAGIIGKAIDSSRHLTTLDIRHCTSYQLQLKFESLSPHYDDIASEIIKSVEFIKPVDQKKILHRHITYWL